MDGKRPGRVAELLKQILSETITREVRDPAVQMVTITKVKISDDLRDAKVYFSKIGTPKEQEAAMAGIQRAQNFLRAAIAKKAGLRVVPSLIFVFDDTFDYVANIENLLRKIRGNESAE